MIGHLALSRNLLLVDLRGTGTSTPLNCPALERAGEQAVRAAVQPAGGHLRQLS